MDVLNHLKFRKELAQDDLATLSEIQQKIAQSSVTPDRTDCFIIELLDLIHRGLAVDNPKYIDRVFFDFYVIRSNTESHLKRIYNQLTEIANYEESSREEQMHLVNLYRNIVADAFDPYLTLIVATLEFIDGKFVSIQQANLGHGERTKYDYSFSKLKPTKLFDGYSPVVRNAVSHTGTDGILYEEGQVVFRNIKRINPPIITAFEVWTNQQLHEKILQLMDFVHAVDACIEIIGFDVSNIIKDDKNLSNKFFDEILTRDHRLEIHTDLERQIEKILNFESKSYSEKMRALGAIFSMECKKRNIPFKSIGFDNEKKQVWIEIPVSPTDFTIDNQIVDKALKLIRYGAIAVLLFRFYYERFVITESKNDRVDYMSVEVSGTDLDKYAKEEIGLYDILNDGSIFINEVRIDVTIDFGRLKEMEYLSIGRRFPRKSR